MTKAWHALVFALLGVWARDPDADRRRKYRDLIVSV